jgi:hypothetical protein
MQKCTFPGISSVSPLCHFLKIISKRGAKKGGKPSSTKSGFQHVKRFLIIKEVLLSCFEVKKRPWVECGGSIRNHPVPKFELDFCEKSLQKSKLRFWLY